MHRLKVTGSALRLDISEAPLLKFSEDRCNHIIQAIRKSRWAEILKYLQYLLFDVLPIDKVVFPIFGSKFIRELNNFFAIAYVLVEDLIL